MKDWALDIRNYHLPQNAKTADKAKTDQYMTDDWIVEEKHDGTRCILYIGHWTEEHTLNPEARAFSRNISVADDLPGELTALIPHLTSRFNYTYLHGTVLDCEIIHKHGFGASREIMGSSVTRANAMQFGEPISVKTLWQTGDTFKTNALARLEKERKKDRKPPVDMVTFYENDKGKIDIAPWYGPVTAVVFDVLRYGTKDYVELQTPLRDRLKVLDDLFLDGLGQQPYMKKSPRFPAKTFGEVYHALVLRKGGEGTMLKHLDHVYQPCTWDAKKRKVKDSRPHEWRKRKKENTFDVVIIGYDAPEQYSVKVGETEPTLTRLWINGWIGAVRFGVYDGDELIAVGRCSGMDDNVRAMLSKDGDKYLGAVIEVLSNFMSDTTYALHHPRFIRFRPDKSAKDCTLEAHKSAGKGVMRK